MKSHVPHLIAVCVLAAGVLVGYCAWYMVVSAKSVSVAVLENDIVAQTATVSRTASARAALSEIADDEATVQQYFIPEANVVTFINTLESIGREQGASVNVLSVSASKTRPQNAFDFALTATGTFSAVMRAVGAIEYAPYDLSIASVNLSANDTNVWSANITLTVGAIKSATSTP